MQLIGDKADKLLQQSKVAFFVDVANRIDSGLDIGDEAKEFLASIPHELGVMMSQY